VIARACDVTEATVKIHMKSMLRKIQVANRTQATVWALENGHCAPTVLKPPVGCGLLNGGTIVGTRNFVRVANRLSTKSIYLALIAGLLIVLQTAPDTFQRTTP
jgi:hypothetical protein